MGDPGLAELAAMSLASVVITFVVSLSACFCADLVFAAYVNWKDRGD